MYSFKFIHKGEELDFNTRSVPVDRVVTITVTEPLWKAVGKLKTIDELRSMGVSVKAIPAQSQERLDYELAVSLFQANADLSVRVSEFMELYDQLELPYTASVSDIETAETIKYGEGSVERSDFHDKFMGKRTEVLVNLSAAADEAGANLHIDDLLAWQLFPVLAQWLPGKYTEVDIPPAAPAEIVESDARLAELQTNA